MQIKKSIRTLFLELVLLPLVLGTSSIAFASPIHGSGVKPRATFEKLWVDFDVTQDGKKGMRIHAAFTVYELKATDCKLVFSILGEGEPLDAVTDSYSFNDHVATVRELKPGFDATEYKDLDSFIPYSAFGLGSGDYQLGIDADVTYPDGGLIEHLTLYEIDYSQAPQGSEPGSRDADFIKESVDYDVVREGKKGMLLHVSLDNVKGLKGVPSAITVRILDGDEDFVGGRTSAYRNSDGEFETRFSMNPGFDPAKYEDAQIFIPYDEIALGKGSYQLKLDIDLKLGDGTLIKHLTFHKFDFKR